MNWQGRIRVHPNYESYPSGWTWTIYLESRKGRSGFAVDATVESRWRYATERSATLAARRWAERLGITTKEPN